MRIWSRVRGSRIRISAACERWTGDSQADGFIDDDTVSLKRLLPGAGISFSNEQILKGRYPDFHKLREQMKKAREKGIAENRNRFVWFVCGFLHCISLHSTHCIIAIRLLYLCNKSPVYILVIIS